MWILNKETGAKFDIEDKELISRCLNQKRYEECKNPIKTKEKTVDKKTDK